MTAERISDKDRGDFFAALTAVMRIYRRDLGWTFTEALVHCAIAMFNERGETYDYGSISEATGIPKETVRRVADSMVERGTHVRTLKGRRPIIGCTAETKRSLRPHTIKIIEEMRGFVHRLDEGTP